MANPLNRTKAVQFVLLGLDVSLNANQLRSTVMNPLDAIPTTSYKTAYYNISKAQLTNAFYFGVPRTDLNVDTSFNIIPLLFRTATTTWMNDVSPTRALITDKLSILDPSASSISVGDDFIQQTAQTLFKNYRGEVLFTNQSTVLEQLRTSVNAAIAVDVSGAYNASGSTLVDSSCNKVYSGIGGSQGNPLNFALKLFEFISVMDASGVLTDLSGSHVAYTNTVSIPVGTCQTLTTVIYDWYAIPFFVGDTIDFLVQLAPSTDQAAALYSSNSVTFSPSLYRIQMQVKDCATTGPPTPPS
jgi:hypothetical protein